MLCSTFTYHLWNPCKLIDYYFETLLHWCCGTNMLVLLTCYAKFVLEITNLDQCHINWNLSLQTMTRCGHIFLIYMVNLLNLILLLFMISNIIFDMHLLLIAEVLSKYGDNSVPSLPVPGRWSAGFLQIANNNERSILAD